MYIDIFFYFDIFFIYIKLIFYYIFLIFLGRTLSQSQRTFTGMACSVPTNQRAWLGVIASTEYLPDTLNCKRSVSVQVNNPPRKMQKPILCFKWTKFSFMYFNEERKIKTSILLIIVSDCLYFSSSLGDSLLSCISSCQPLRCSWRSLPPNWRGWGDI